MERGCQRSDSPAAAGGWPGHVVLLAAAGRPQAQANERACRRLPVDRIISSGVFVGRVHHQSNATGMYPGIPCSIVLLRGGAHVCVWMGGGGVVQWRGSCAVAEGPRLGMPGAIW